MPIYEYKCRDCGKISELLVGVNQDNSEIKCRYCGSNRLEKILSASFKVRSSGFIGSQGGKTCCGRDERCDSPPCSDNGICQR